MSSVNRSNFTLFPIWLAFISFSCLIYLAGASVMLLNRSIKTKHCCLAPILPAWEEGIQFLIIEYDVTSDFLEVPFIRLKKLPSSHSPSVLSF